MDTKQNHQNEKNLPNEALSKSLQSMFSEGLELSRNLEYLAATMEIIRRSILMSSQPSLTNVELGARSKVWQDAFECVGIPLALLSEAFDNAVKNHKGSFPINAHDIVDGYKIYKTEHPPLSDWEFQKRQRCEGGYR